MQTALLKIAPATSGISTSHYLYLNEAAAQALDADDADAVMEALDRQSGHKTLVARCGFPDEESPASRLLRLTQSSAYQRNLAANPGVASRTFVTLRRVTGISLPKDLSANPMPAEQFRRYNPATIDLSRTLDQMESTRDCFAAFAKLPASTDPAFGWTDIFQPALHTLIGSLMMLGGIELNIHRQRRLPGGYFIGWCEQVDRLFKSLSLMLAWATPRIHSLHGGAFALAAQGSTLIAILEGRELAQLVNVLVGLDEGLAVLGDKLLQWSSGRAQAIGQRACAVREEFATPLLTRLAAILNRQPY